MKPITSTFRFSEKAKHPRNAISIIYDLEGFSRFFNQPDVQHYVPLFLNHVSTAVSTCIFGGDEFWKPSKTTCEALKLTVAHEKFMGDGALYVLVPSDDKEDFSPLTIHALCNRLWNLRTFFQKVVEASFDDIPVLEVPKRIRFGVSRGSIYELPIAGRKDSEFVGFCINQASRLQSYCPELGFIASSRIKLPNERLSASGYCRVVARNIKGFPNEIVIVDAEEFNDLSEARKNELFDTSVKV